MNTDEGLTNTLKSFSAVVHYEQSSAEDVIRGVNDLQKGSKGTDTKLSDGGLAAVILGIAQGKALLKLAQESSEKRAKEEESMDDLISCCKKLKTLIETTISDDWGAFTTLAVDSSDALTDAIPKATNDRLLSLCDKSKQEIADVICKACSIYVTQNVYSWMESSMTSINAGGTVSKAAKMLTCKSLDKVNLKVLTPSTVDLLTPVLEVQSLMDEYVNIRRFFWSPPLLRRFTRFPAGKVSSGWSRHG